jgi:hypothetical protein
MRFDYTLTMSRLYSFIVCLLLLAMPLQSFAAATMMACGPNHADKSTATEAVPHDCDGMHHASNAAADEANADSCSACATCCNAHIIVSWPATLQAQSFEHAALSSWALFFADAPLPSPTEPPRA